MKPSFRKKHTDLADFVENDAASVASNETYLPEPSSPINVPVRAPARRTYSKKDKHTRQQTHITPLHTQNIPLSDSEDGVVVPETDPVEPDEFDADSGGQPPVRPLRVAAADAASLIRKHARIDLGYISDLADAYDSDDPDELEADGIEYAPFHTQVQGDSQDQLTDDIPDCEDVGTLDGLQLAKSDQFAELASSIPEHGLFPLIDEARVAEHASGSKFGQYFYEDAKDYWTELSLLSLCSTSERAIIELVCGNLKLAYDSDDELKETLDKLEQRAKQHPCIYTRTLTMADGQPMTITQARRLAKWLQRYVSTEPGIKDHPKCVEAFRRIDGEFQGQWRRSNPEAERAYLATTSSSRLDSRVQNVRVFCQQLLAECDRCEALDIQLRPLLYIGYAAKADRRKRQHEACGKSANWLATLVQAICNVLWGRGRFMMHFMVICVLAEKRQGMVAEMLFTRITGAYYTAGRGFCIDVAGKSMESLHFKELTVVQNVDIWNQYYEWVEQNTALLSNGELQAQRHERYRRYQKEKLRSDIERLEAQAREHRRQAREDLDRIADCHALCLRYSGDASWQDDEAQDMVRRVAELFQRTRHL